MSTQKKYLNSKQFKKELQGQGRLDEIYLFLGEEEGEKEKCIAMILERLFPDETERRNASSLFHLDDPGDLLRATEYVLMQSIFSPKKACIMRNAERLQNNRAVSEMLCNLIEEKSTGTTVIITTTETKPPAAFPEDLLSKCKIVQFWRLYDEDLYNYIVYSLRKEKVEFDASAVEQLMELTGKDIKKIDEALGMIVFSGESGTITSEIVKNYIHDTKSTTVFEFLDHLFMRERKAFAVLKKLVEEGTPYLLILAMIMKDAETLERYYSFVEQGMSQDESMKKAGVPPRAVERFTKRLQQFSQESVRDLFRSIGAVDRAIKGGSSSKELLSNPLFDLVSDVMLGGDRLHVS